VSREGSLPSQPAAGCRLVSCLPRGVPLHFPGDSRKLAPGSVSCARNWCWSEKWPLCELLGPADAAPEPPWGVAGGLSHGGECVQTSTTQGPAATPGLCAASRGESLSYRGHLRSSSCLGVFCVACLGVFCVACLGVFCVCLPRCLMLPASVSSVLPASVSSVLPASVSYVLPAWVSSVLPASVSSVLPASVSSVLPASVSSVLPASVSSVLPASVSSVLPASVSYVLPAWVSSVLPASVSSVLPAWVSSVLPAYGVFCVACLGVSVSPASVSLCCLPRCLL